MEWNNPRNIETLSCEARVSPKDRTWVCFAFTYFGWKCFALTAALLFQVPVCASWVSHMLFLSHFPSNANPKIPKKWMHLVIHYIAVFTKLFLKPIPQQFCCIHWVCAGPDLDIFPLIIQWLALRPALPSSSCWLWGWTLFFLLIFIWVDLWYSPLWQPAPTRGFSAFVFRSLP